MGEKERVLASEDAGCDRCVDPILFAVHYRGGAGLGQQIAGWDAVCTACGQVLYVVAPLLGQRAGGREVFSPGTALLTVPEARTLVPAAQAFLDRRAAEGLDPDED